MKKTIVIGLIALSGLFFACSKADNGEVVKNTQPQTVYASIDDDATKIALELNSGKVSWKDGDRIYLIGHGSDELWGFNQFNLTSGAGSNIAAFKDVSGLTASDWAKGDAFIAVLGATGPNYQARNGWHVASEYPGMSVPENQIYQDGGPKEDYLWMISEVTADLKRFNFRNVMSIIKVPVKCKASSGPVNLTQIRLRVTSGDGLAAATNLSPILRKTHTWTIGATPVFNGTPNNSFHTVNLTGITGSLTTTARDFYIVTYPGTRTGLTITLMAEGEEDKTFTYSESSFTTTAGKITVLPEIDWASK